MPLTTYTAGEVLTAASLNDNFNYAVTVPAAPATAIFNESQASGTNGGSNATGSYVKRTLNTTVINTITGCSIASSVITLPAGTFLVYASAPGFEVGSHKIRLQNMTASTTLQLGTSSYNESINDVQTTSVLQAYFTLATSSTIEVQHRFGVVKAANGLGAAAGFGDSEVYSQIQIQKVA